MNPEVAIIKIVTAIAGEIGAYFSLSKQPGEYTLRSVFSFLSVGGVISYFGTPFLVKWAEHNIPHVKDDQDLLVAASALCAFTLGILSMNVAVAIYNAGVVLREDPARFVGWISTAFTKLAALFQGGKK